MRKEKDDEIDDKDPAVKLCVLTMLATTVFAMSAQAF